MKAALALIFFACIAGSMANTPGQAVDQLLTHAHAAAQNVLVQLQQRVTDLAQGAMSKIESLVGSFGGRFDFNLGNIKDELIGQIQQLFGSLLGGVLGGLQGAIGGGRGISDISEFFRNFIDSISGHVTEMGKHVMNQGLASVIGGLGSFGGSRSIGEIWSSLTQQITSAALNAHGAIKEIVSTTSNNLTQLGANLLDSAKPHWQQLQENLVGHGLNALGSFAQGISGLHGTITGTNSG